MSNFDRTKTWLQACGKEPSEAAASVQLGCHIEEVTELLSCIRTDKEGYAMLLERCITDLSWLAVKLKSGDSLAYIPPHLRIDALDALCDCEVTGNGVAYLLGMDKAGADDAVLDANEAKLVDGKPIILPGGKIGKPPSWQAPNLEPFV